MPDFSGEFAKNGIFAIISFLLACVIGIMARFIVKLYDRIYDIQEERRKENEAVRTELTNTLRTFSQSADLLVGKIDIVKKEEQK